MVGGGRGWAEGEGRRVRDGLALVNAVRAQPRELSRHGVPRRVCGGGARLGEGEGLLQRAPLLVRTRRLRARLAPLLALGGEALLCALKPLLRADELRAEQRHGALPQLGQLVLLLTQRVRHRRHRRLPLSPQLLECRPRARQVALAGRASLLRRYRAALRLRGGGLRAIARRLRGGGACAQRVVVVHPAAQHVHP